MEVVFPFCLALPVRAQHASARTRTETVSTRAQLALRGTVCSFLREMTWQRRSEFPQAVRVQRSRVFQMQIRPNDFTSKSNPNRKAHNFKIKSYLNPKSYHWY